MYIIVKIFSYLPLQVLYTISDLLYFLIYRIIGYRKRVVRDNLLKAFPAKTEDERSKIEDKFYRNFCDFIVETVKGVSIDEKDVMNRVEFTNLQELKLLLNQNRSMLFLASHQFNWELMQLSAALQFPIEIDYIYHPLHSKASDNFMLKLRGRFGAHPVKRREVGRHVIKRRNENRGYALLADQFPSKRDKKVWIDFFKNETAYFQAIEQIARLIDSPVTYFHITKEARGRYKVRMIQLSNDPKEEPEGAIVKAYSKAIEDNIMEQPEGWLWSHKRWKLSRGQIINS